MSSVHQNSSHTHTHTISVAGENMGTTQTHRYIAKTQHGLTKYLANQNRSSQHASHTSKHRSWKCCLPNRNHTGASANIWGVSPPRGFRSRRERGRVLQGIPRPWPLSSETPPPAEPAQWENPNIARSGTSGRNNTVPVVGESRPHSNATTRGHKMSSQH